MPPRFPRMSQITILQLTTVSNYPYNKLPLSLINSTQPTSVSNYHYLKLPSEDTDVKEGDINSSLRSGGAFKENSIIRSDDIGNKEDPYVESNRDKWKTIRWTLTYKSKQRLLVNISSNVA